MYHFHITRQTIRQVERGILKTDYKWNSESWWLVFVRSSGLDFASRTGNYRTSTQKTMVMQTIWWRSMTLLLSKKLKRRYLHKNRETVGVDNKPNEFLKVINWQTFYLNYAMSVFYMAWCLVLGASIICPLSK